MIREELCGELKNYRPAMIDCGASVRIRKPGIQKALLLGRQTMTHPSGCYGVILNVGIFMDSSRMTVRKIIH